MNNWQNLSPQSLPLLVGESLKECWQSGKQYLFMLGSMSIAIWFTGGGKVALILLISILIAWLTFRQYQRYRFSISTSTVSLSWGGYTRHLLQINTKDIVHCHWDQSLAQQLFGLKTLNVYLEGKAEPALVLKHLCNYQRQLAEDILPMNKCKASSVHGRRISSNSLLGALTGPLFPYLSTGLVIIIPIMMSLSMFATVPVTQPNAAKQIISETVTMGLIPLLGTLLVSLPIYLLTCILGRIAHYLYDFSFARYKLIGETVCGKVGMVQRKTWQISVKDVEYIEVTTSFFMRIFGKYNIRFMHFNAQQTTFLIPGVGKADLDLILQSAGFNVLDTRRYKRPDSLLYLFEIHKSFPLAIVPAYMILCYVLPASVILSVPLEIHIVILLGLIAVGLFLTWIAYRHVCFEMYEGNYVVGLNSLRQTYLFFSKDKVQAEIKRSANIPGLDKRIVSQRFMLARRTFGYSICENSCKY
tara:strand:- start:1860 stop:3275 length:1416 start_codon:yes stop_codon:yes gene_type:complete